MRALVRKASLLQQRHDAHHDVQKYQPSKLTVCALRCKGRLRQTPSPLEYSYRRWPARIKFSSSTPVANISTASRDCMHTLRSHASLSRDITPFSTAYPQRRWLLVVNPTCTRADANLPGSRTGRQCHTPSWQWHPLPVKFSSSTSVTMMAIEKPGQHLRRRRCGGGLRPAHQIHVLGRLSGCRPIQWQCGAGGGSCGDGALGVPANRHDAAVMQAHVDGAPPVRMDRAPRSRG